MIKVLLSLFLTISSVSAALGQQISVSSFAYNFSIPQDEGQIQSKHYVQLVERIKANFKNRVSFSNQSPFTIVPRIAIISDMNAGEVDNIKVMKLEIQFTLENPALEATFNSFSKTTVATGENIDVAIRKAIQELRPNDKKLQEFLASGEALIKNFYSDNCEKIIKSAKVNIDRKEYSKAYALLSYVPEELACYAEVENLITSIYAEQKNEYCGKQLLKAQLAEAKESYRDALQLLRYIDPSSACYQQVTLLLQQIGSKVNAETIREFEMEKLVFEKKSDLEKMKILVSHTDTIALHIHD